MQRFRHAFIKIYQWTGSPSFIWFLVTLFVLNALWIALTARYPMAFDEDFHLGVIQIYAEQWHPFLASQPPDANQFGAVARDASYLYHYLMSFPYRFLAAITNSEAFIVIVLRVMNIAFFALSLPLFRVLLRRTGASDRLIHLSLLAYLLIPIAPLLAGQINYDNVMIPLTALALWLTLRLYDKLRDGTIDLRLTGWLAVVCLLTSIIKYAFIPIFLAIVLMLTYGLLRWILRPHRLSAALHDSLKTLQLKSSVVLCAVLLVSLGLFMQRIGVNVIRYGTPAPDCGQVLSVDACKEYGPWGRDYLLHQQVSGPAPGLVQYIDEWTYGMWFRSYFAVDGPTTRYQTRGPLVAPAVGALVFAALGLVLLAIYRRSLPALVRPYAIGLLLFTASLYTAILFYDQYQLYLYTHQPVAINGRYLLPLLPVIILALGLGYAALCRQHRKIGATIILAMFVCLSLGGGALTYIVRSNEAWYWQSPAVRSVNYSVQKVLRPVLPGGNRPNAFLR